MTASLTPTANRLLALDPGPAETAFCVYESERLLRFSKIANEQLLKQILNVSGVNTECEWSGFGDCEHMAVEMIASYGMPVGREVFETCVWIGRFVQAWNRPHSLVYRQQVKLNLCRSARANDATIRQALVDRFGPGKDKAIGKKASPGPLYGVSGDVWSALAIAVTYGDLHAQETAP